MTEAHWWDFSTNPLVLLGAGAFFSGLLIPKFTRGWQDHQAELNLKTELVRKISNSIVELTRAVEKQMELSRDTDKELKLPQEELKLPQEKPEEKAQEAADNWHKACPTIGSDIEAYFYKPRKDISSRIKAFFYGPNKDKKLTIPDKWSAYTEILDSLYKYPGLTNDEKVEFEALVLKAKQKVFEDQKEKPSESRDSDPWKRIKSDVYAMKHKLMQEIITSNITGFSKFRIG